MQFSRMPVLACSFGVHLTLFQIYWSFQCFFICNNQIYRYVVKKREQSIRDIVEKKFRISFLKDTNIIPSRTVTTKTAVTVSFPPNLQCITFVFILYVYTSLDRFIHSSIYLLCVSVSAGGFFSLPKKQDNMLLVGGLAEPCCSFSIFMTERCARNCFHTPSHLISSSPYSNYLSFIHLSILP